MSLNGSDNLHYHIRKGKAFSLKIESHKVLKHSPYIGSADIDNMSLNGSDNLHYHIRKGKEIYTVLHNQVLAGLTR